MSAQIGLTRFPLSYIFSPGNRVNGLVSGRYSALTYGPFHFEYISKPSRRVNALNPKASFDSSPANHFISG
jgi:hypothetical protein